MTLAGLDAEEIANAVEDQFTSRLAGGEEAFVSFMYAFAERLQHTRFVVAAGRFATRLSDLSYIRSLRELWKARQMDVKKLPKNEELIARLPVAGMIDGKNPLTGTDREEQHDNGIL
jgi:hypothetical protein